MIEVNVDNYICLAILRCKYNLDHLAGGVLHEIHDVCPENNNNEEDSTLLNELKKGEGEWAVNKEVLRRLLEGTHKTLQPPGERITKLNNHLNTMLQSIS